MTGLRVKAVEGASGPDPSESEDRFHTFLMNWTQDEREGHQRTQVLAGAAEGCSHQELNWDTHWDADQEIRSRASY